MFDDNSCKYIYKAEWSFPRFRSNKPPTHFHILINSKFIYAFTWLWIILTILLAKNQVLVYLFYVEGLNFLLIKPGFSSNQTTSTKLHIFQANSSGM